MNMSAFVDDLQDRGVLLTLDGDLIEVDAPEGVLTDSDVAFLIANKPKAREVLQSRCRPHHNAKNYIDQEDSQRPGWVRSKCKLCGCFVGYRELVTTLPAAAARLIPESRTSSSGLPLLSDHLMNRGDEHDGYAF